MKEIHASRLRKASMQISGSFIEVKRAKLT